MTANKGETSGDFSKGEGLLLVVDDEPIMRKIAINVLQTCGYEVIAAEDGDVAVEIFEERHQEIKLVLLDLLMPRKSGKETYVEMKRIKPDVNVLLISGARRDKRISELLEMGVKGYLEKPYTFPHLSQLVLSLVS